MNLKTLQTKLRDFAAERDWQPFHTPKNLAMALMVEAAELAEIFQWMTPEQSQAAKSEPGVQERIADEVADVLLYLLQIADHTGVDLERAAEQKLVKNAKKHPALRQAPPAALPDAVEPQTHVLVDWENVQPKDVDIRALAPDVTDVWLFHGPNQKRVDAHQLSFGERATLVPIARTGKNALDFHLTFYMGYIASKRPGARFVVISNDKGYGAMLEHMVDLGFAAKQVGFDNGRSATAKAAKDAAVGSVQATGKVEPSKATPATPAQKSKTAAADGKPATPKKALPVKKATPAKKAVPVKAAKPAVKAVAAKKAATAKGAKPVPVKSVPAAKKVAKPAKAAPTAGASTTKSAAVVSIHAQDLTKALHHVQSSLKKMASPPTRKVKLQASIKSLLGSPDDGGRMVHDVLTRLLASGKVVMDDKGVVEYKF